MLSKPAPKHSMDHETNCLVLGDIRTIVYDYNSGLWLFLGKNRPKLTGHPQSKYKKT